MYELAENATVQALFQSAVRELDVDQKLKQLKYHYLLIALCHRPPCQAMRSIICTFAKRSVLRPTISLS